MWHIIAGLSVLAGTVICHLKQIYQKMKGLNDNQAMHPGFAKEEVYNKWHQYKKFELFYDKYNLS